jgi:hypothetical protein
MYGPQAFFAQAKNEQQGLYGLPEIAVQHRNVELFLGERRIAEDDNLADMHVASGSSITVRFVCSSSADTGNPRSLVSFERALRIQQRANRDLIKSPESTAWANLKFDRVSGRDSVPVLFGVGRRCTAFSLKVSIALCLKLSHAHRSSCLCNKAFAEQHIRDRSPTSRIPDIFLSF